MMLSSGTRLGPYEILAPLGEGGMGVVYKANDTRLGRTVALKFVKAEFNQRWEREARAIAALNHPHIATLYDVGEHEGSPYLAMEYVKGAPLKGPCPVKEVIEYGIQMADALAAAHAAGIVHRDLKPGNILVTEKGSVKVLDFGLAKLAEQTAEGATAVTQTAAIAGTPGYLAPEQLNGKSADARSDIFAFGCILYELVSGRRAFPGETMAAALASTALAEPKPLEGAPERLEELIERCLRKDPERRQQSMADAKVALEDIRDGVQTVAGRPAAQPAGSRLGWMILAALLGLAAASLAVVHFREKRAELPVVRVTIGAPEKTVFTSPALVSPDGRRIVFSATSADSKAQLWVRALDALAAQPLAGTDRGIPWFWSPDGRSIGFYGGGKLMKIDAAGGPPLTLAAAPNMRGGAWSPEEVVIFAPSTTGPLMRAPAAGGAASPATKLDASRGENTHRYPWFLPDGCHFLFAAGDNLAEHRAIRIGSLDSLESRVLLEADSNAIYAQGYLLFLRETTLMAQPFDAKRLALTGEAAPLAEHVRRVPTAAYGFFSASETGLLAYDTVGGSGGLRLTWMDRDGKRLATAGDPADLGIPNLSPDQKRAAVSVNMGGNRDVWIYDLARGLRTRFTFDNAAQSGAVWSPDGRSIVFSSHSKGSWDLFRKASDGTGAQELLYSDGLEKHPTSWSPDGRFVLYWAPGNTKTTPTADIWILPLAAGAKPHPLVQAGFAEYHPQFSPDGRWVAYQSNESGQYEIYVIPFGAEGSAQGGKWQVSTAGGEDVRWRRDGKALFFIAPGQKLMEAEVSVKGGTFESGPVSALPLALPPAALFGGYDVAADGKSFLIVMPPEQSTNPEPLTVVQNWTAGLKK
jgi:Tol biopolymer transport system component